MWITAVGLAAFAFLFCLADIEFREIRKLKKGVAPVPYYILTI